MTIETTTYKLPGFWGSALINGDTSGLSVEDEDALDSWLARESVEMKRFECVDMSEEGSFMRYHDASEWVLACDAHEFTFIIEPE